MFEIPACSKVQHQFSCNLTNLTHICDLAFSFFANLFFFILKSSVVRNNRVATLVQTYCVIKVTYLVWCSLTQSLFWTHDCYR